MNAPTEAIRTLASQIYTLEDLRQKTQELPDDDSRKALLEALSCDSDKNQLLRQAADERREGDLAYDGLGAPATTTARYKTPLALLAEKALAARVQVSTNWTGLNPALET